jgi:subtilisin family serine protease
MHGWILSAAPKALRRFLLAIALTGGIPAGDVWIASELTGINAAFAQADDGGDDDGDDGGGRGGASSSGSQGGDRSVGPRRLRGGNLLRGLQRRFQPRVQRRAAVRRPVAPQPPPVRAADEIVAVGLTNDQTTALTTAGFTVLQRANLSFAGSEVVKLRIPSGAGAEAALNQVRAAAPGASADFNHYFRPGQDSLDCSAERCPARGLVAWPGESMFACSGRPTIGLIDTAINADHAAFAKNQVEVVRLSGEELPESGRQHGTAVAALLVGDAGSTTPGLLPGANLIAVDAFYRGARQDDRADAYDLVRALDLLAGRKVDVVNMSLAGPANAVLEKLVRQVGAETVLVAAAGNQGPKAGPVFPAAYPEVFAVTAVDRRKQAYRRAGRGEHIDLAAPGVGVWTAASVSGARSKTGTSFAAPFVTAAAALVKSSGMETVADIHDVLAKSAEDLGEPGKDPVFGWGLLNARALCEARG